MPSVPPSPNIASSSSKSSRQSSSSDANARTPLDKGREGMQAQDEYGVGGGVGVGVGVGAAMGDAATLNRHPPSRAGDQPAGAHEVSRVLPPYELQPLPSSSMFYNKEFTTSPFAYVTTQPTQAGPPPAPPPHQYGYHPYRVPHSSSPPALFGGPSMMSMGSFMSTMQDSYPLTNPSPSPAGSISSSLGGSVSSPMGSPLSSFGSHLSDMSSMGYSPPMHAPSPLPGMPYANPRELASRRPRTSHRRIHPRSVKSEEEDDDDDDDMLDDDDRVGLGISVQGAQGARGPIRDAKAEAGRLSRIQSEQRLMWQKRRNVLKDGFERLRAILPPTNQKGSKQVVLDRAVQHIDAIKTSNSLLYEERGRLMAENRRLTEELVELRRANNLLVSSHIPPPASGERGPNGSSSSGRGSAHFGARA